MRSTAGAQYNSPSDPLLKAGLEAGDVIILLHEVRQDRALDFLSLDNVF
jgi:hypothetical protein